MTYCTTAVIDEASLTLEEGEIYGLQKSARRGACAPFCGVQDNNNHLTIQPLTDQASKTPIGVVYTQKMPEMPGVSQAGCLPEMPVCLQRALPCFTPAAGSPLEKSQAIISLDSEWQQVAEQRNHVLSYQWSALHQPKPSDWKLAEGIYRVDDDARLTFGRYLGLSLESLGIGYKAAADMSILLVAHFAYADLAQFADRKDIFKLFKTVRGTLVTMGKPVEIVAQFSNKHTAKVRVTLRDSMLLAPQKQGSLEKVSQYTTHKKKEIDPYWKEHMAKLREQEPATFDAYAIGDTRTALEYFVNVVDKLAVITKASGVPVTLSSAAVKGLIVSYGGGKSEQYYSVFGFEDVWFINSKGHNQQMRDKCNQRKLSERLAGESYMGGLNTAFEASTVYTPDPDVGTGSIILDIDFAQAYPSAMAGIAAVNWLAGASEVGNIDGVLEMYSQKNLYNCGHVPLVMGLVSFEFPKDVAYPCLPVRYGNGLFYPRKGQTFCTGPEIVAAVHMGARVTLECVNYFRALFQDDGKPLLPFAGFLSALVAERKQYASNTLFNMLYKEVACSLYGKMAQGIVDRTMLNHYDESDGSIKKLKLPESDITCPHYAAMTTGIVRAALATVIAELAGRPGFRILSATTDGCMIVAPRRFDPDVLPVKKDGVVDPEGLDLLKLYPELKALESTPAVLALRRGRRELGQAGPWIIAKHIGDQADTYRTRVNHIRYKGVMQSEAHTGVATDVDSLEELHGQSGLVTQTGYRLPNVRELMTGKVKDFVQIPFTKTVNTDFDFKRRLLPDGTTRPFEDMQEFMKTRDVAKRLRSTDKERATAERVDAKLTASQAGLHTKKGEKSADVYRRYIHKAIAKHIDGWDVHKTGKEIAALLGIDYRTQFKNYSQREFIFHNVDRTPLLEQVAAEEATKLGTRVIPSMIDILVR